MRSSWIAIILTEPTKEGRDHVGHARLVLRGKLASQMRAVSASPHRCLRTSLVTDAAVGIAVFDSVVPSQDWWDDVSDVAPSRRQVKQAARGRPSPAKASLDSRNLLSICSTCSRERHLGFR
ncbi:hypothetical protein RB213_001513 [Colletotrichum asianum]